MDATDAIRSLTQRKFPPRIFRTSAFRYTLMFFLIFILSVGGIGYFVVASTLGSQKKRFDEELVAEITYFAQVNAQFSGDGNEGLNAIVNEVARLNIWRQDAMYLVLVGRDNERFLKLSGDLNEVPEEALFTDEMFEFTYDAQVIDRETNRATTERRPAVGRRANFIYATSEGDPLTVVIITARDISELEEITDTARTVLFRTGIFSLFLALMLGGLYSGMFLRRVDQIGRTVRLIRDGDLTKRIALAGTNDEFDTLSDNINAMLDQIERLMTGMRQVSDNIAHDLRSPLTRIKARLEQAQTDPNADLATTLDHAAVDVEKLLATFNALLSITRIESGEGGGSKVAVDITAVAEEMLELYEPATDEQGFELVARIQPAPEVLGSRELISQAIANLLDNALKYASRGSDADTDIKPVVELTVAARPGGGALLSVMDNGPGVSEADQERILQRFVRLERSRSTTGNGLGLSLVSAIARRHGAQLSIGRGLPHRPGKRTLSPTSAYGLGVRIAFPAPLKPAKGPLIATAERNAQKPATPIPDET